jgi:hypothetical protein
MFLNITLFFCFFLIIIKKHNLKFHILTKKKIFFDIINHFNIFFLYNILKIECYLKFIQLNQ